MVTFGMNSIPMGAGIDDVMMTMGDDPMMVEAMFTDADGQDLTYEWMSSDEMVATVMADDMDMRASITAVGDWSQPHHGDRRPTRDGGMADGHDLRLTVESWESWPPTLASADITVLMMVGRRHT